MPTAFTPNMALPRRCQTCIWSFEERPLGPTSRRLSLQLMLEITPTLAIDENEITTEFIRASGPGGQNVNKVETAVQLRFDVAHSPSLPDDVRTRLLRLARN